MIQSGVRSVVRSVVRPVLGKLGSSSGSSWTHYWTPQKPLGGETPTQWFTSRSGLNMIDSLGGASAAIQLPYLYKPTGNEYAYVTDNGALDIANNLGQNGGVGDTGFTICGWAKAETALKTDYRYYMGKPGTNATNGIYQIASWITNGFIYCAFRTSTNIFVITSDIDITANGMPWYFVRLTINTTTSVGHLYINETEVGAGIAFTGTFAALNNAFDFMIGGGNGNAGSGVQKLSLSSHSDTYIFPWPLSTEQGAILMARGNVTGASFYTDCVLRSDNVIYDLSGNGRHLTGVNLLRATKKLFSASGSNQELTVGYSRYTKASDIDINIPYTQAGAPLAGFTPPAGYVFAENNPASATKHNGADSYIEVAGVDRSNTTDCTYLARATVVKGRYKAANVNWIHATELNNLGVLNIFHDAQQRKYYIKKTGQTIEEFFIYTTNKIEADWITATKYCGDHIPYLQYSFIDDHVIATRDNKWLVYDGTNLKLSLDQGATYAYTLNVNATIDYVTMGFIFANGNILIGGNTKAYYSNNNLTSIIESTVYDVDGGAFTPGATINNFRSIVFNEWTVDGVSMLIWGTYQVAATFLCNHWYTIDNGVTIKSFYQWGYSEPALDAEHSHGLVQNPSDGSIWAMTGDAAGSLHWMRYVYTASTDSWTWTELKEGTVNANTQASSSWAFYDGYAYWINDYDIAASSGMWRVPYADIGDSAKYERLFYAGHAGDFIADGVEQLSSIFDGFKSFLVSNDSLNYRYMRITGGAALVVGEEYILPPLQKNSNGYYIWMQMVTGYNTNNWMAHGQVIKIKVLTT